LPAPIADILGPGFDFEEPRESLSRQELMDAVADAEGLIALLTVAVDGELFEAAPRLKVVANFAVGYDNVDVAEASRRGILVCNTPAVLTEATADLTWGLILSAARRLPEGDVLVRSGHWSGWFPDQHLGLRIHGQTLGIIGLGRIGAAVARRAAGFGMRVLYASRNPADAAGAIGATRVSLEQLLEDSHVVSIHCPLSPETRHLIDGDALARMRSDAILVNTSRGPIIDEAALARALEAGSIAGAGLDVFEDEPAVHPGLVANPRAVLVPHIGSATVSARRAMGELCATGVRDALSGKTPANAVNPEVSR